MRSTSASRNPRWRAAISSAPDSCGMPMASATSLATKPSAPRAFSQPAIERKPTLSSGAGGAPGDAAAAMHTQASSAFNAPRMNPPWQDCFIRLFYGFGRVLFGDLVVEEAGGVRRRHEAPVDLRIDADVLVDLAVRHFHFERACRFVVAD